MAGGDIDKLITSTVHRPLLSELMVSMDMKAHMGAIANEIKARYVAKVPKESGNLASTAKVTYEHSKAIRDRRWEAVFSVGGPRAPYVVDVEHHQGILASVLREMGYNIGDVVHGPRGRDAGRHAPRG